MNCASVRNLLDLHAEKRLAPAASAAVRDHLKGCPVCAAQAQAARPLPPAGPVAAPADLKERLRGALSSGIAPRPAAAPKRWALSWSGPAAFWYGTAETALLLLTLILPLAFYLRTYDSAMVKTTLFQAGVLVLVFSWLFKGLERGRWEFPERAAPLILPAVLLFGWTVLRFATSPYKVASLPGFLQQVLTIALYALCVLEFGGARSASRFLGRLLWAGWLAGLYGLAQRLGFDPFIWKGAFGERVFSTMANPDLYGGFIALCLPALAAKLADPERDTWLKAADLGLAILLAANLVWASSVDGLAAFALMGLAAAIFLPMFLPSRAALRAAAFLLVLVLGTLAAGAALRGDRLAAQAVQRTAFKRHTWAATLRMTLERPLTGHGPGSFHVHYPRLRPPEIIRLEGRHNSMTDHPENALLETASELGLVGAALWAWLFGAVLAAAWRARRLFLGQIALAESCALGGLFAAAAGFLACSVLGLGSWLLVPGFFLWPLAGVLGGLTTLARPGSVRVLPLPFSPAQGRRAYAPALLALGALLFFPGAWFLSDIEHNVAIYHSKEKAWADALAHYDRVTPGAPAYVMAQYFKGNVYLDSGRTEEALRQYARVQSLAPDYVLLHHQKALAYEKLGDWKNALASRERQRRLDPLFVPNLSLMVKAALAAGELEKARSAAYAAIAREPKDPAHWSALSEVYLKEKRTLAARRVQREAARLRTARKGTAPKG